MTEYQRRIVAAENEMTNARVLPAHAKPLLFRLLRFAGWRARPPLYQSFLGIAFQTAISFGLLWGSLAYFVFWRPTGNEVIEMLVGIWIGMMLYGMMLALFTTRRAKTLGLSDWDDL
jgi:hypothetical protein